MSTFPDLTGPAKLRPVTLLSEPERYSGLLWAWDKCWAEPRWHSSLFPWVGHAQPTWPVYSWDKHQPHHIRSSRVLCALTELEDADWTKNRTYIPLLDLLADTRQWQCIFVNLKQSFSFFFKWRLPLVSQRFHLVHSVLGFRTEGSTTPLQTDNCS